MKIGELTGELTECDGWDIDRDTECKNLVRVRHDPYSTVQLALCSECSGAGEVYGPLDEPYWEDEHDITPECCAECKHQHEIEQADVDRYAAECDAAHEEERRRFAQERPLWSRAWHWVVRLLRRER